MRRPQTSPPHARPRKPRDRAPRSIHGGPRTALAVRPGATVRPSRSTKSPPTQAERPRCGRAVRLARACMPAPSESIPYDAPVLPLAATKLEPIRTELRKPKHRIAQRVKKALSTRPTVRPRPIPPRLPGWRTTLPRNAAAAAPADAEKQIPSYARINANSTPRAAHDPARIRLKHQ